MNKKILSTLIIVSTFTVIPVLAKPNLMIQIEWIIATVSLLVLFLTQPALNFNEVKKKKSADKYSILLILLMCGISTIVPIIEWAYNKNGEHVDFFYLITGSTLIIVGLVIRISAINVLGNHFTATVQITKKHQLITKSIYKYIRHPSYLGAFIYFVGISLLLESWLGLIITIISMMIAYYVRISIEEATLLDHFGDEYKEYQRKTKKMFPYIW